MAIDSSTSLTALGGAMDPAAKVAQRQAANEAARAAEIAKIKEVGFSAYAKEIEEEKIKKMREDILKSMGLSEEDLAAMDPKARDNVEKAIAQEIQKRLAAASAANSDGKGNGLAPRQQVLTTLAEGAGVDLGGAASAAKMSSADKSVLLSLQEVEPERTGVTADAKDSRERGRGLPG